MTILRFNDGVNVDTSGLLRPLHLKDGWYVVGEGYLSPAKSRKDALRQIAEIKARKREADHIDGYDRDDLGESPDY